MIPGATAMQTAAYVGLRSSGLAGAGVCFVGFGLPAFCFMVVFSALYAHTYDLPPVLAAFQNLRAMTVAIVANASITFGKRTLRGAADIIIAGLAATLFGIKVNPIVVILIAALLGLALYRRHNNLKPHAKDELTAQVRSRQRTTPLLIVVAVGFVLLFVTDRGLFDLGILMFRIDLFAFGGGFASVPLMYHETVDVRSWLNGETFMNGIALGQVTPGPIVITATYVGYLLRGIAGAVVATVTVFLPSFLLVVGIVPYFDRLRASDCFNRCITGILASFVGLLLSVTFQFALGVSWNSPRIVFAGAALAVLLLGVEVLWVVLLGIVISLTML